MPDANGNQTNSHDYAYHNALPGTTPGANATGVVDESVIVAGGAAPGAHPYTDMVGGNGMRSEASQALLNPAFAPTEEAAHGQDAQQQAALSAAADAGLAPGDPDNPAAVDRNPAGGPGDNHNAQIPNAPVVTSAVAGVAGHATVDWTAPVDPDDYALTAYRVTATSSDGGALVTADVAGNVLTANVAGLTSAKHYTFTVHAVNVAGPGPESAASAAVLVA